MSAQIYYLESKMIQKSLTEDMSVRLTKVDDMIDFDHERLIKLGVEYDYSLDDDPGQAERLLPYLENKADIKKVVAYVELNGSLKDKESFSKYFSFELKDLKRINLSEAHNVVQLINTFLVRIKKEKEDIERAFSTSERFDSSKIVNFPRHDVDHVKLENEPAHRRKFIIYKQRIKAMTKKNPFLEKVEKISADYLDEKEIVEINAMIGRCLGSPDLNAITASFMRVFAAWAGFEDSMPQKNGDELFYREVFKEILNRKQNDDETYESYVKDAFPSLKAEIELKMRYKYSELEGEVDDDDYQRHRQDALDFAYFSMLMKARIAIAELLADAKALDAPPALIGRVVRLTKTWPRFCDASWKAALNLEEASQGRSKTLNEIMKAPEI